MPANDGTLADVLLQQGFSAAAAAAIDKAVWDAGIGGSGDVVGGGVVEDGLLVVDHEGADFAMLPKIGTGVKANLSVRTGLKASLLSLSGNAGEIAMTTDTRELVLFNGVAGQAIVLNTGDKFRIVSGDAAVNYSVSTTLEADDSTLIVRNTGAAASVFEKSVITLAARPEGSSFRIVSDCAVSVGSSAVQTPNFLAETRWVWRDGAAQCVSSVGLGADGSVLVGKDAFFTAEEGTLKNSIMLGSKARVSNDNEIVFGAANFDGAPGNALRTRSAGFFQLYGSTTTSGQALTLTPTGLAGTGWVLDVGLANGVFSIDITVIGKKNSSTDVAVFKRQIIVKLSGGWVPSIVIPATPNNASDVIDSSMAGSALAFATNTTTGTLEVNVTAPTTAATCRWYAVGFVVKMGNT